VKRMAPTAALVATIAVMALAYACGASEEGDLGTGERSEGSGEKTARDGDGTESDAARTAVPAVPAGKGSIRGKVAFTGTPPTPARLDRDTDAVCKATPMNAEDVLVENGMLANVIVRLTKGAPRVPGTGSIEIDQTACMYRPRASAIVAGQKIVVKNGDQTMHNVHTYPPEGERPFNRAQVPGSPAFEVQYTTNGAVVVFRCDVHPWMEAYVSVTSHPFFAVTGADGTFEIRDVPSGTYTLESWHEKFGTKTQEVTVTTGGTVEANFSFDGTETPTG